MNPMNPLLVPELFSRVSSSLNGEHESGAAAFPECVAWSDRQDSGAGASPKFLASFPAPVSFPSARAFVGAVAPSFLVGLMLPIMGWKPRRSLRCQSIGWTTKPEAALKIEIAPKIFILLHGWNVLCFGSIRRQVQFVAKSCLEEKHLVRSPWRMSAITDKHRNSVGTCSKLR